MHGQSLAAQEAPPLVSISVVSHGDWGPLSALLESLAAFEPIGQMQLIVTDNLRTDLPDLATTGWHSVVMVRPERPRGFAANHNAAFSNAAGDYFCVLNPDVLFTESVFRILIQRLQDGSGQIAAPILVDSQGVIQDSFRDLPTPPRILARRLRLAPSPPPPEPLRLIHPDWIAGMFMLMRASTFSSLGGFDPHYRLYFEDVDLCTRLRLAGMSVMVDPSLRLLHDPRRRSRRPGLFLAWHIQSALRFFSSRSYRLARRMHTRA